MSKLFALRGDVQNYLWGGTNYISDLLGLEKSNDKSAEYWLGAHSNSPSKLLVGDDYKKLDEFINSDLKDNLGIEVTDKFGRLPFLFKVLDVHEMLSIQVHPSKKAAEIGFALENELGIPKNASNRNYKDDNHKPEIMVALSEFWLLHGFLQKDILEKRLNDIPEFSSLINIFKNEGYFGLYRTVMEQSVEETNKMLTPLVERILPLYKDGKIKKSNPDYWASKSVLSSNNSDILDKGIYSIYFFNLLSAKKGEAIFQDAGIPHAYLEGQNMELMANSDNVLRGGLTPKHIDVKELLKHVIFDETIPKILEGNIQEDGLERIYSTSAPDFELSQIKVSKSDRYHSISKTAEILIVIEGEVKIEEGNNVMILKKGSSVYLKTSCNYFISTSNYGEIYKATAPVNSNF